VDFADAGERDAGDGARDGGGERCSEEELVVLAAVKSGVERCLGSLGAGEWVEWKLCGLDLGGDVGCGAEVGEVGGEAVGEVDAGSCEAAAEDGLAGSEAGLREEMRVVSVVVR
jgi:hypothetical protein